MKSLLLVLVLIIIIGCSKNDDEFLPITISTTLIGNGNLYGYGKENIKEQNLIISNIDAWAELMNKMNSVNNETNNFTEVKIDFSHFIILAVFDKIEMSGGYKVDIMGVVENQYDLKVSIRHLPPNGSAYAVITQPYYIVKIPKTEKPIIFKKI